jgi:hypothetical protein
MREHVSTPFSLTHSFIFQVHGMGSNVLMRESLSLVRFGTRPHHPAIHPLPFWSTDGPSTLR